MSVDAETSLAPASLTPATEAELAELVADHRRSGAPLRIAGGGTRVDTAHLPGDTLGMSRLAGVVTYAPGEMTLIARAGTPLEDINALLAAEDQALAFEPPDMRGALGTRGRPTIGGVVAANASGPRRLLAGACRDHLLGLRFVDGQGRVIKNGGRVMKNVTGLDLVKLTCGAWGTLGVLSEAIFKVLPKPARSLSLGLRGLDDMTAISALTAALGSTFAVSAAAHIPASIGSDSTTIVRLEGSEGSVAYGSRELARLWCSFGLPDLIEGDESANFWLRIRDAHWLAQPMDRSI